MLFRSANITFTTAKTVYWSLAAGGNFSANAWATSSGGAPATANLPLPQDTVIIDNTGLTTSNTITIDSTYLLYFALNGTSLGYMPTINCTRTNAWTLASTTLTPQFNNSSITLPSVTTMTGTGIWTIFGTGTLTIGTTFVPPLTIGINGITTSTTLGSALTASGGVTLTFGTLNLNNFTLTTNTFADRKSTRLNSSH